MASTVVITGASSGVGLAAATQFASRGDTVVLIGRDPHRLSTAVSQVQQITGHEPAHFRTDFESFTEVRTLAAHLLADYPRIDVLANNAGGMVAPYRRTPDGFEATIQSNHLSPFLLTTLLQDRLGRVVNTASRAHVQGRPDPAGLAGDPDNYSAWRAYGASKAANILFTAEAARRWPGVFSVSFHPGVVRSNFGVGAVTRFFYRYAPFLVTPEKAGELLVWLATAPEAELVDGGYYVGRKLTRPAPHARTPLSRPNCGKPAAPPPHPDGRMDRCRTIPMSPLSGTR